MVGIQAIGCCPSTKAMNVANTNNNSQMVNNQIGLAEDVFEKQDSVSFGSKQKLFKVIKPSKVKKANIQKPSIHLKVKRQPTKRLVPLKQKKASKFNKIG